MPENMEPMENEIVEEVETEPQIVVTAESLPADETAAVPETSEEGQELKQFENRIDEILATGQLDETLRVTDTDGVAQVLPVLDSEPISHLLAGIEEIGGRANVFVHTDDGIAVLTVEEFTPNDEAEDADDTPTGETPIVTETVEETITDDAE